MSRIARVLILLPARDFDPSEAAVCWQVLSNAGHAITYAEEHFLRVYHEASGMMVALTVLMLVGVVLAAGIQLL